MYWDADEVLCLTTPYLNTFKGSVVQREFAQSNIQYKLQ